MRTIHQISMVGLLMLTASALRAEPPSTPAMMYGDSDRLGRPFAKDPSVIRFDNRYLLYYSMAAYSKQLAPPGAPNGWAIGVAESADLVHWKKIGEILPRQPCERNGIVNGRAILLDGKLHLFYNTYGNFAKDALCHAVSADGLHFDRDPTNPVWHPTGSWNLGRAIDLDVVEWGDRLVMYYATREPGDWNASETGHPGVFEDVDGRTYLFVQGNNDRGRTWFLSCYEIAWKNGLPVVVWDSPKFPMKRLVSSGRRRP